MTTDNLPAQEDDLPEQLRIRREKRASLIERGVERFLVPNRSKKSARNMSDSILM